MKGQSLGNDFKAINFDNKLPFEIRFKQWERENQERGNLESERLKSFFKAFESNEKKNQDSGKAKRKAYQEKLESKGIRIAKPFNPLQGGIFESNQGKGLKPNERLLKGYYIESGKGEIEYQKARKELKGKALRMKIIKKSERESFFQGLKKNQELIDKSLKLLDNASIRKALIEKSKAYQREKEIESLKIQASIYQENQRLLALIK